MGKKKEEGGEGEGVFRALDGMQNFGVACNFPHGATFADIVMGAVSCGTKK